MAVGFGVAVAFGVAVGFGVADTDGFGLADALGDGLGLALGVALGDADGDALGSGSTIGGSTLKRSTLTLTPAALPVGIFDKKYGPTSAALAEVPRSFSYAAMVLIGFLVWSSIRK